MAVETILRITAQMKPCSGDRKYSIRVQGAELTLFKELCEVLPESYQLDTRIRKYKGTRAIGFWSWDLDYLESVFDYERRSRPVGDTVFASLDAMIGKLIAEARRDRAG